MFGTSTDISGIDVLQNDKPLLEIELSSLGWIEVSAKGTWAGHPQCLLHHTFPPNWPNTACAPLNPLLSEE